MEIVGNNLPDLVGFFVSLFLTLSVFSYVLKDNALFKLAIHIFVGVATGYAAMVAIYNVILPHLLVPLFSSNRSEQALALVPMLLSGLLVMKISPHLARWGNPAMAYLVGVGAAVGIGGAVIGTIFPQVSASINLFDKQVIQASGISPGLHTTNALVMIVGVVSTLAYFHFGVRDNRNQSPRRQIWIEFLGVVGKVYIAITFGVLFAGVYSSAMSALVERLDLIINFIKNLIISIFP